MQQCGTSAPPSHASTLAGCLRRARRILRERPRRVRHSPPGRRAFELASVKVALSRHGARRPSHRGTCARRVTRPLLPALSRRARRRCQGLTGDACVARRSQESSAPPLSVDSLSGQRQRSPTRRRRLAPRLAPRRLARQRRARRLQGSARATMLGTGARRARPRQAAAQQRAQRLADAGERRRTRRTRVPRKPAGATRSAVCAPSAVRQDTRPLSYVWLRGCALHCVRRALDARSGERS